MSFDRSKTKSRRQGLVMVITGDGKGKTTSSFGQALRAVGQDLKVCIIQFMKGRDYGEVLAVKKYLPSIQLYQYGLDSFVMRDNPAPVDRELAMEGLEKAEEVINSNEFDMVILDEINVAIEFDLVPEERVLSLIQNKSPDLFLILSGRYATDFIKDRADLVSEVQEVKHHYKAGIKDQPGIEY